MNERARFETIDEYIARAPEGVRPILEEIRAVIRENAPNAEEKIAYQLPTFSQQGHLVHFGAFQDHIGFYPSPSGTVHFQEELALYSGGKGSVRFPLDRPIPYTLIAEIVRFRLQENEAKALEKKNRPKGKKQG